MHNTLTDIVKHTHSLGFIPLLKITGSETETLIEAMSDDRSVVVTAKLKTPVVEFDGVFGMPNLGKLDQHLKNPEYKEHAKINVVAGSKLHFENQSGDFSNDYRFMSTEIINEKLKSVKFRGAGWNVECTPDDEAIRRLKLQSQAHEEDTFQVKTQNGQLVFIFGSDATHSGSFVFHPSITGSLSRTHSWKDTQVLSILSLEGEKTMKLSDAGAMLLTVASKYATYEYILPAMSN